MHVTESKPRLIVFNATWIDEKLANAPKASYRPRLLHHHPDLTAPKQARTRLLHPARRDVARRTPRAPHASAPIVVKSAISRPTKSQHPNLSFVIPANKKSKRKVKLVSAKKAEAGSQRRREMQLARSAMSAT